MPVNKTTETSFIPGMAGSSFASDIKTGLRSKPKTIPSKYFYDARGDFLFRQIMQMDEYYLTDCEYEILESSKRQLLENFMEDHQPFDLVELGAGDGTKTKILLGHFLENNVIFNYVPIDISQNALDILSRDLSRSFPNLGHTIACGDYLEILQNMKNRGYKKKAVLFLGSNIGNFCIPEAVAFLRKISNSLSPGDLLLIGFDLKKNPELILNAYNDKEGITREFNLNLLERINRELGGNFNVSGFSHFPVYDPENGEARSYLVSLKAQKVVLEALQEEFYFDCWEPIHTEVSLKYSIQQVRALADSSGFQIKAHFFDHRRFFVDSLWKVN